MKSQSVLQLDAFAGAPSQPTIISEAIVRSQPTFMAAITLAQTVSGLDDKQIYGPLGIDHAQWSRIRSGSANFPLNRLPEFLELVGNDIPLSWLAFKRGFEVKPLRSALERQIQDLQQQLDEALKAKETIVRFVQETRRG